MKRQVLILVLTCGRCGTVFTANALQQCPGVTTCHERNGRLMRLLQNSAEASNKYRFAGDIETYLIRRSLNKVGNGIHFEVNLPIRPFVDKVVFSFPEARLVHIIRDPREHVRSGVNWAEQHPVNRWFKLHVPYWSQQPPRSLLPGDSSRDKLFAIAAWNWRLSNKAYSGLKKSTVNYFSLRFEELMADPVRFLNHLLDIAGYDNDEGRKELPAIVDMADRNASQGKFPSWPDWPDKYIQSLDKICGPLMEQYGYGQEDEWRERIAR